MRRGGASATFFLPLYYGINSVLNATVLCVLLRCRTDAFAALFWEATFSRLVFLCSQPIGHESSMNTSCFGSSIGQGDNTSSPGVNEACTVAVADGIEVGSCSCSDRDDTLRCIPVETTLEDVVLYVLSDLAVRLHFLVLGWCNVPDHNGHGWATMGGRQAT
jgi:hypothetical protein